MPAWAAAIPGAIRAALPNAASASLRLPRLSSASPLPIWASAMRGSPRSTPSNAASASALLPLMRRAYPIATLPMGWTPSARSASSSASIDAPARPLRASANRLTPRVASLNSFMALETGLSAAASSPRPPPVAPPMLERRARRIYAVRDRGGAGPRSGGAGAVPAARAPPGADLRPGRMRPHLIWPPDSGRPWARRDRGRTREAEPAPAALRFRIMAPPPPRGLRTNGARKKRRRHSPGATGGRRMRRARMRGPGCTRDACRGSRWSGTLIRRWMKG